MARILLIDDEAVARFTIRDFLESAGHAVVEAHNGNEGILLLQQVAFDLVITDVIMPEKDGVDTTREIKKHLPNVKIIAISGGGRSRNFDLLAVARTFGADRVLAKPFTETQLLQMVDDCLAKAS